MTQLRIPGTRGGWPAEMALYYEQQTGGRLPPARIGAWLGPILKAWRREGCPRNPYGYEDPLDLLKLAFGRWVRSEKRKYGPEYLAREIGEFLRGRGYESHYRRRPGVRADQGGRGRPDRGRV